MVIMRDPLDYDCSEECGQFEIDEPSSTGASDFCEGNQMKNISSYDEDDKDAYLDAARDGEYAALHNIVRRYKSKLSGNLALYQEFVLARDERGNSAYHYAAANGHVQILSFLLSPETGVEGVHNIINSEGSSILHWAVRCRQLDVVKILLSYPRNPSDVDPPADVLAVSKSGKSVISIALELDIKDLDILQLLLEHSSAAKLEEAGTWNSSGDVLRSSPPLCEKRVDTLAGEAANGRSSETSYVEHARHRPDNTINAGPFKDDGVAQLSDICTAGEVVHILNLYGGDSLSSSCRAQAKMEMSSVLLIREVALDSIPSGKYERMRSPESALRYREGDRSTDMTGVHCWGAAVVGGQWISSLASRGVFGGKSILELGAGCGVMGLAALVYSHEIPELPNEECVRINDVTETEPLSKLESASHDIEDQREDHEVHNSKCPKNLSLTDLPEHTLENLVSNVTLNGMLHDSHDSDMIHRLGKMKLVENRSESIRTQIFGTHVDVSKLDWFDVSTWPKKSSAAGNKWEPVDVLFGSDLIYQVDMVDGLVHVVKNLLAKPHGVFYYAFQTERAGAAEFMERLEGAGFKLQKRDAPASYTRNPFLSGSKEEMTKYFPELRKEPFVLLTCTWH